MDSGTLLWRKFHQGSRAGVLSYKTIARFEFQDLSEIQVENPAVENELNI